MTKQSFRLKSYVIIYIQQKNSHPYGKGAPTSCKGSPYVQQRKSLHVAKEASHTAKGAIDTQKGRRLYTLIYIIYSKGRRLYTAKESFGTFSKGLLFSKNGGYLLSHGCAVPSARTGLTSLFGMGRGGTPTL